MPNISCYTAWLMDFSKYFEDNFPSIESDLFELLCYESVASEVEHVQDTLDCANWLKTHLESIGFATELMPVPDTAPCVFGSLHVADDLPTVLLYGHYDVQPPGNLPAWQSDPFSPVTRDGRVYARGARDNKGQFFFNLKAMEAVHKAGQLKYNLKVLLDGEEESASLMTLAEIPKWKDKIQCDIVMASETQGGSDGTPAIVMGYRGISYMRLNMHGANRSLHSGHYGGIVRNPAVELSRLVASLFDDNGTIQVEGFYDDLLPATEEERKLLKQTAFNEKKLQESLGIDAFYGHPDYSVQERVAFLPVIEFPGISGGYVGRAVRAIIPPLAQLKMTIRTARGQDGQRILKCMEKHLQSHVPDGVRLEVEKKGVICPALAASVHSDSVRKASTVIKEQFSVEPGFLWVGATLSAIAQIVEVTGAEPLLVGFGLPQDAEHGENESFALEQFKKGFLYASKFLSSS